MSHTLPARVQTLKADAAGTVGDVFNKKENLVRLCGVMSVSGPCCDSE